MSDVNIAGVDLNLLVVVDAVLEELSATRAAARLHVTQSAVSNALGRARALFGDPLVTRSARGFVPTPRGAALAPRLRALLSETRAVIADTAGFDEATSTRRFTVAATDAVMLVLFPALMRRFSQRLPRAALRGVSLEHAAAKGLDHEGLDMLVGIPPTLPSGALAADLFDDELVVIVRDDHPAVGRRLSRATYAQLPHAELALFGAPDDRVDRALAAHGLRRRVEVMVPHIAALPFLVAGSDRVATVMACLARMHAGSLGLRVLSPPVALAPLMVRMVWHQRVDADPAHRVLRELLQGAASALPRAPRRQRR